MGTLPHDRIGEVLFGRTGGRCDEALKAFVGRRYGYRGQDFVEEVAIRTHEFAFSHISDYSSDRGASFETRLFWQSRDIAKHA